MNLAFPAGLLWGLVAIPVIALYLIRIRRRRVTVGYLRLWEQLLLETRARSMFQRLKRWFSLLVQLLILLFLALSLGNPSVDVAEAEKEHIVILLDTSASMRVMEKDPDDPEAEERRRFDIMMEQAHQIVEQRGFEDSVMIVAVSDRVDVLCPFDRNTVRLREALDRAAPTNRSLDAKRALAFARQVTGDKTAPRIVFLSDGGAGKVQDVLAADSQEERAIFVGHETENVGIVQFSARKNTSLGTDYVLARVENFGAEDRVVRLELDLDGAVQRVVDKPIPAGEALVERYQLTLPEGGVLRLRASVKTDEGAQAKDALAVDDVAYAVVQPTRLRRVILITELEAQVIPFRIAFESMREAIDPSSRALTLAAWEKLSPEERQADILICVGKIPAELPPRSNLILIGTDVPDFLPAEVTGIDQKPTVWDWEREHLLNRYLNYRDLPLPPARILSLTSGTALVSSFEGPLIAAFELQARRVVYVAFDMTSSLFPFRLAFPMLLRNSIAWFELSEDLLLEPAYAPGEVIAPLRPVGAQDVEVTWYLPGTEQEKRTELGVDEGRFYFTGTDSPGPYLVKIGEAEHLTCVNLFDPGESRVAPPPEAVEDPGLVREEGGLLRRELWPLLALLGLILWTAEWATYHSRVTE